MDELPGQTALEQAAKTTKATKAAPATAGVAPIEFRETAGEQGVAYYLYVPLTAAANAPILVSVHGISRNAFEHVSALAGEAEAHGVVIVAPLFDEARFPDFQRLGRNGHGQRADLALRRVLDDMTRYTGRNSERFYLYGHSGGGQFAHRYAMAYPDRIIRYAVSAAGWYTLPDRSMKFPHGMGETKALPGLRFAMHPFLRVPACIFVGARDTVRDGALNKSVFADSYQGRNRVERARHWVEAMRTAARWHDLPTAYDFRILPRAGHDFTDLVRDGGLPDALFRCLFGSR